MTSIRRAMENRRAPFYLRRTKEAMVYFPERAAEGEWLARKVFSKRIPHSVERRAISRARYTRRNPSEGKRSVKTPSQAAARWTSAGVQFQGSSSASCWSGGLRCGPGRRQIGFGIAAVELGGLDQGVDCGSAFTAGVGAGEQVVLAAEREGREARSAALLSISRLPSSAKRAERVQRERCSGSLWQFGLLRQRLSVSSSQAARRRADRLAALPGRLRVVGRLPAYRHPRQRRDRRCGRAPPWCDGEAVAAWIVEELAPRMGPAGRFGRSCRRRKMR